MADVQARDVYDSVRLPLVGGMQRTPGSSTSNGTGDEIMINCFPQVAQNPMTGEKEVWIAKRPGMEKVTIDLTSVLGAVSSVCFANITITQLNDIYVAGIYDATNFKFVICQYRPITGTTTKIGEITGVSGLDQLFITELTIANVANIGVVWNSNNGTTSKGYYAASVAGVFPAASLVEITDVDFPPKQVSPLPLVGPMVQMNGTTYVLTNTGVIAGSDLNSITSWNSLNTVQAISYPDQGVSLCRYKNYILCFGEDSIEFFSDVGNPAPLSALQRQEQAFIKFGTTTAKSVLGVDDSVFWLGRSSSGATGLWRMDGFTPVKVSGPVEDQIIEYAAPNSGRYQVHQLSCLSVLGQKNIIIGGCNFRPGLLCSATISGDPQGLTNSLSTNSGMLTFNIAEQKFWGIKLAASYATSQDAIPMATAQFQLNNTNTSTQYVLLGGTGFPSSDVGSYIYRCVVDAYYWTDQLSSGTRQCFPVVYQVNRWMAGNQKRKRVHKYHLVIDPLASQAADPDTGSYLWFLYAKDTWEPVSSSSFARFVAVPNTFGRYYIQNLGSSRTWLMGWASMNRMAMRMRAIEIDLSQGDM
jgi:hypothetical protein